MATGQSRVLSLLRLRRLQLSRQWPITINPSPFWLQWLPGSLNLSEGFRHPPREVWYNNVRCAFVRALESLPSTTLYCSGPIRANTVLRRAAGTGTGAFHALLLLPCDPRNSSSFIVCSATDGEDPHCSDSIPLLDDTHEHDVYLNTTMGC
jgi:hypothetical protein